MTRKNITSLAIVVVIGLAIQAALVAFALDGKKTPAETAESFARAYYRLDPSMAQWMCGTSAVTCGNCVRGSESMDCSKANCSKKSTECPKAVSDKESANCPEAASGDGSVKCSKADCANKSMNCANEQDDCSKADCPREMARRTNVAIENYLYEARQDAAERGFSENFAKYTLYRVETRTEYIDDATALVHLTARRRLEINPIYAYVARLFRIGDTYEVDASIRVMRENGDWRVCKSSISSLEVS